MLDADDGNLRGPSTALDDVEDPSCSGIARVRMRDVLVYYEKILKENNLVESTPSPVIPTEARLIAEDLFHYTLRILNEKKNYNT